MADIIPVEGKADIDLGNDLIGNAWISSGKVRRSYENTPIHTKERDIFVLSPSSDLSNVLAEMVRNAKEYVCASSFLLQDSNFTKEMLTASERGVRCYLLTAREQELTESEEDRSDHQNEIIKAHVALLNKLQGNVLVRTAPHFHAKYLLIDPTLKSKAGIVSTCNFTIDAMAGKNVELAGTLTAKEIGMFYRHFCQGFWFEARHELVGPRTLRPPAAPPKTISNSIPKEALVTSKEGGNLKDGILSLIASAKKNIVMGAWSFDRDGQVIQELLSKLNSGVDIRIITNPNARNFTSLGHLAKAGARIGSITRFHAKFLVVDGAQGIIMTSNFSRLGLDEGFEVGISLGTEGAKAMERLANSFWDDSEYVHRTEARVSELIPGSSSIKVIDEKTSYEIGLDPKSNDQNLGKVEVTLMEQLKDSKPDVKRYINPNRSDSKKFYRVGHLKATFTPPYLVKEFDPVKIVDGHPIVLGRKDKHKYLPICDWDELDVARKIANDEKARLVVEKRETIREIIKRIQDIMGRNTRSV